MRDFHSKGYPALKRVMMKIGQELSIPDFQIAIYPLTKSKETQLGSVYAFKITVGTPDYVSEEETIRRINEKNWQKIIIERLCEHYPDAKEVENGIHIPGIGIISIPDTIFLKYSKEENRLNPQ